MPITLNGDTGIVTPMYNGSITANAVTPSVNMKNRIINGAMVIDQRNAGASITPTDAQYALDRWMCRLSQASKYTVQQNAGSVTPPTGFKNYLGVTSSSAYSVASGDYFAIEQNIEGYNYSDFDWGSANAKTVTLSFWVRSSLTGTFGGGIRNGTGSQYTYPFSYTISASNTWEQKTVTITGPTATWSSNTTNGLGVVVTFGLGVGSTYSGTAGAWTSSVNALSATGATSVVGTNGATFYITGVQLEVGNTATSFDYRPYGTEFSLCERYFQKYNGNANGNANDGGFVTVCIYSATFGFTAITFPQMRTGPSFAYSSLSDFTLVSDGTSRSPLTSFTSNGSNNNRMELALSWSSNLTNGFSAWLRINTPSGFYSLSAEL